MIIPPPKSFTSLTFFVGVIRKQVGEVGVRHFIVIAFIYVLHFIEILLCLMNKLYGITPYVFILLSLAMFLKQS